MSKYILYTQICPHCQQIVHTPSLVKFCPICGAVMEVLSEELVV